MSAGSDGLTISANQVINWLDAIARMFRYYHGNDIVEGFHRTMKLIQRRAYGFRNFENYRLRV
ncbi:transposase [uncultured Desulfuromonas sp.]|uniref:transposase n=1 Tax=uncultured Desulfuromonas sp. TaxID=181013 RepID=UPI002AAB0604|nr:transposase [uncultured Desulfuromonas sp.]